MEKKQTFTYHCKGETVGAADALVEVSGFSKAKIKGLMSAGAVWLHAGKKQKVIRRASSLVKKDEKIKLYFDPNIKEFDMSKVQCVHDTHNWGIWFKPAGLLSQGTKYGDEFTILRHIEKSINREVFLIHRLDRETSGLMIFAYNKKAARLLSEQIRERSIRKFYQAVVHGTLSESGESHDPIDDKEAHTKYEVVSHKDGNTNLDVEIITGRKHQIRIHLANIGYPVIGDKAYGKRDGRSLKLVAYKLILNDPYRPEKQLEVSISEKEKLF